MQHAKWRRKPLQGFRRNTGTKEITRETQWGVRFGMKMDMSVSVHWVHWLVQRPAARGHRSVFSVCSVSN
jgi:hypothetical protein